MEMTANDMHAVLTQYKYPFKLSIHKKYSINFYHVTFRYKKHKKYFHII